MAAPASPWDPDELAWAREAFCCGDPLAEIADSCERSILDVARAIGVDHASPRDLRWRQSGLGQGNRSPWVGLLHKEVVAERLRVGERICDLAREARVHPASLSDALKRWRARA